MRRNGMTASVLVALVALVAAASPAVADYVWDEVLASRPAPAHYWRVPCGNHYLQKDRPGDVLAIVLGESLAAHQESHCEATYLFRTTDGGR